MTEIKWLAGLGNPGAGYYYHRHSIGFRLVDAIHQAGRFSAWQPAQQKQALMAKGEFAGHKLQLIKPMAYMNLSGQVLQGAMAKAQEKITLGNIMVLHDEIDISFAQIKIKCDGGDAGHNGLKDISARLGRDYHRLRFGVGHPGARHLVADFVLQNFSLEEEAQLEKIIPLFVDNFHHVLAGDNATFLHGFTPQQKKISGQ